MSFNGYKDKLAWPVTLSQSAIILSGIIVAYEGFVPGYLIFLPVAYLLSVKISYGVYGGYIAFLLWTAVDCIAFAYRFFYQRKWQKNAKV